MQNERPREQLRGIDPRANHAAFTVNAKGAMTLVGKSRRLRRQNLPTATLTLYIANSAYPDPSICWATA